MDNYFNYLPNELIVIITNDLELLDILKSL